MTRPQRETCDSPYCVEGSMARDDEAVCMAGAMAYEREQGWHPDDVLADNLGFDLRSLRYAAEGTFAEARHIEVKARARFGAIRLTANEWKKARHFGPQFWLYIVTRAKTGEPQLHRIHDLTEEFTMNEDIVATGFIIAESKWSQRVS